MRRLPFLNGMRAFEAAARLGGFAAAATELGVTAAAVSRLVRLLELRMGTTLFERSANRLTLSPAGRTYRDGLGPILDRLAALTEQVAARDDSRTLTVGVGSTFAIRWLIPRLAAFRRHAPDIEVRLATGGFTVPYRDDWTCGISLGTGDRPGFVATRLFDAGLLPVCAPGFKPRPRTPAELSGKTLLRIAQAPEDWPHWLEAAGASRVRATGPTFDNYGLAIQAASDGVGIAVGIRPYVDDEIAAGRLVALFPLTVPMGRSWYLYHLPGREQEAPFATFAKWIVEAARKPTRKGRRR
ncbi:MAG: LysR family transcriptional regulator [Proteobacteria bacterium]|nr:LysR family transcriptional regulator [Pseudomonadota bacterium]